MGEVDGGRVGEVFAAEVGGGVFAWAKDAKKRRRIRKINFFIVILSFPS